MKEEHPYTICPIQNVEHRQKLQKYLKERGKLKNKSSYCRFFLRGICIMKPEYCKFAHSFAELDLPEDPFFDQEYPPQNNIKEEKEAKKKEFVNKRQFNQGALFILRSTPYFVLYHYQFSQRYKKTGKPVASQDQINKDQKLRHRIRQILHRQQWDGLIHYLEEKYPNIDFPVSLLSLKYAWFGFDKPQTRCKFGDFIKYMMHVKNYLQIQIVMPPYLTKAQVYLVNGERKVTYLQKNIQQIHKIVMDKKSEQVKQKMDMIQSKQLPEELHKKFICRYYMAGNCPAETSKDCKYAHSIDELNYSINQQFLPKYHQLVLPLEKRLNYKTLSDYAKSKQEFSEYSEMDINFHSAIRNQVRNKCHLQIYGDFMKLLEEKFLKTSFQLRQLQKYYESAGFNHTRQNKFHNLEHALWPLRYCIEDITLKQNSEKRKTSIVYKIDQDKQLYQKYYVKIKESIENEFEKMEEDEQVLESAIRRNVYSRREDYFLPLHAYLRLRNGTFQQLLQEMFPQYTHRIFFETSQQNLKKLNEILKKYFKKKKKYLYKITQIEDHIKLEKKEFLNINHFVNFRSIIQRLIIDMGKHIYFWPFENNAYAVDKNYSPEYEKSLEIYEGKIDILQCEGIQMEGYTGQRSVIVDCFENYLKSEKILPKCRIFGVDLEGRLNEKGFVDLIQVSTKWRFDEKQYKQIFVFDFFKMKNSEELEKTLNSSIALLKSIFEDQTKVKILHDCRQDSIALYSLLGIKLKNVFDTAGMNIYYEQQKIYETSSGSKGHSILKRIYDVKLPSLNTILDTWKAPNGINIFKDSMKKRFGTENRKYFEERPIDEEFLEYSIRDVEDLVEVYTEMKPFDKENLRYFVGSLYSETNLK